MVPVLLRIREQPRAELVKGVHITGTPYSSRQVMKGNCFGAISFDNVPVAAGDIMSAFISVDSAAAPGNRFVLAKGQPHIPSSQNPKPVSLTPQRLRLRQVTRAPCTTCAC